MITESMLFKDLGFAHRISAAYWFSTQDMSCIWALHTEYGRHKFALVFCCHQVSLSFQAWARNTRWRVLPTTCSDEGSDGHQKNDRKLTPTEKDPRQLVLWVDGPTPCFLEFTDLHFGFRHIHVSGKHRSV